MKLNQYQWNPETDLRGSGAFAEVFEAKDNNGDSVALKIYRESIIKASNGGSLQGKYTLQKEFSKGKLLSHTNIIRYIGLDYLVHTDVMDRETSYPVLIMEYADAGSLEGRLRSTFSLSMDDTMTIATEMLSGLGYLHEEGIVHRDLKPDNILFKIGKKGNLVTKIADFGISRDVLEENLSGVSTTTGVGTTGYMAPEQFLNKKFGIDGTISNRTDIWAVGVMLYRMLTGKLPFGGENKNYEALQEAITETEPDYSNVPARMVPVIKGCLEKYAVRRFADAEAVIKALKSIQTEKTIDNNTDHGSTTIVKPKEKDSDNNFNNNNNRSAFDNYHKKQKKNTWAVPTVIVAVVLVAIFVIFKLVTMTHRVENKVFNLGTNNEYTYDGTVKDDLPDGTGVLVYKSNSATYTGDFVKGVKSGHGKMTWPSGESYEGAFADNVRNGRGVEIAPDKSRYDGEWKNDKYDGQGTEYYPDGKKKYEGMFSANALNGDGTFYYTNGDYYTGSFVNGLKSGHGVLVTTSGQKYDGMWLNDYRSGLGKNTWQTGESYDGNWENGKRNGQGTEIYPDKGSYVGEWKDDLCSGKGAEYNANGTMIRSGLYFGGKLILAN